MYHTSRRKRPRVIACLAGDGFDKDIGQLDTKDKDIEVEEGERV
jgi:hypothetical protein